MGNDRPGDNIVVNGQGALVVVGDVLVSAWRRPYQIEAIEDIARIVDAFDPDHRGALSSLSIFRFERVRPADFADVAIRKRMVELSQSCRFKIALNVLDGPGLVNSTIRLGLAGMMSVLRMPYPVQTVGSVDGALQLLPTQTPSQREAVLATIRSLENQVWPK